MHTPQRFLRLFLAVLALALTTASIRFSFAQTTKSAVPPKSSTPTAQPRPTPPDDDAEVVRVETDLVNTLFTAVDKDHHFITTLRAEDVAISENNVPQKISLFERETDRPLSLAILIDTSDSQRGVLSDEKNAAAAFV